VGTRTVAVPRERVVRWFTTFAERHGEPRLAVLDGALEADAPDGASASARPPLGARLTGPATPAALAEAATAPPRWGVLLVRKGGFGVAVVEGERITASKVGRRHVQGRTKAGGQSQQRFARRRDNQARQAYEAAAEHAVRLLVGPLDVLVCGGDRGAVEAVLADPRLRRAAAVRDDLWLAVPDPRQAVLEQAVADALAVRVTVTDPDGTTPDGTLAGSDPANGS